MSKSRTTALAAVCLMLSACGGSGATEPRCCATLEGTWVSPAGHLTLQIVVGPDLICSHQYGYCEDSGSGTYTQSGGVSGSFFVTGSYFVNIGQSATITMSDTITNATTIFSGTFVSATELRGTLYDAPDNSGLFGPGHTGEPMLLNKQ